MLISDSMPLLWLSYIGLSLIVLVSGYLGLAFLPRWLRLPITLLVAGMLWMPMRFHLPLIEEGEFYTGLAPAVVVTTVALLDKNGAVFLSAGLLVIAGALLGLALGILGAWRGQKRNASEQDAGEGAVEKPASSRMQNNNDRRSERGRKQKPQPRQRQEPKIG